MRSFISVIAFVVSVLPCASVFSEDSVQSLAELVRNVQSAESLYENISVAYRSTYRLTEHGKLGLSDTQITEESSSCTHLSFGELQRIDVTGKSASSSETQSRNRIHAYDGSMTRLVEQNAVMNIRPGRQRDKHYFRPHTLVYSFLDPVEPLSVKLLGDDAYTAFTGKKPRITGYKTKYSGLEQVGEYLCARVDLVLGEEAHPLWTTLWLGVDRNYIPVRVEMYQASDSADKPKCVGVVKSFTEIATGVWVPNSIGILYYDRSVLRETGRQVASWQRDIDVDSAELVYDVNLNVFSDVHAPTGPVVYEINSSGGVVSKKAEGRTNQKKTEAGSASGRTKFWVTNGVFVLVVAVVFLYRRYTLVSARQR